jgi:hypothetical protein
LKRGKSKIYSPTLVASNVKAHFEKSKKEIEAKRNPEKPYPLLPKVELRKRVEEHTKKMREARKPLPKSYYERQLHKGIKAQLAKTQQERVFHSSGTHQDLCPC